MISNGLRRRMRRIYRAGYILATAVATRRVVTVLSVPMMIAGLLMLSDVIVARDSGGEVHREGNGRPSGGDGRRRQFTQ